MKKTILFAIVFTVIVFNVGCSGGGGVGSVTGTITDGDAPLSNVQVILCENAPKNAEEHLICTLKSSPTTTTGSDGTFELTDVPAGSYVIMYGLPDQLKLTPEEWDGIPITRGTFCMEGMKNSVCDIDGVESSLFWSEGAWHIATLTAMEYQDDEKQPGVVIVANAKEGTAGEHTHIYLGTLRSTYAGISSNILAGQYAPQVEVVGGKTFAVDIVAPIDN